MTPLAAAKLKLSIPELWRMRNWHGRPGRSCHVPWREDHRASGSVFANGRLFHDFATGQTLDGPALLSRTENLSAADACRLFIHLADGAATPTAQPPTKSRCPEVVAIELPPMDSPTRHDLKQLAALRCMSVESCEAAAEQKHLFFATWSGARCWIITDCARRAAQIRRLDGDQFRRRDGTSVKALTARGSCASWPIGAADVGDAERLVICEGGGDFLAAYHFAVAEETLGTTRPIGMLGAAQKFAPEALARFGGKRVRIFPHLDTAGAGAALRWESQLRDAKIDVHCFDLAGLTYNNGTPVKDLNDLTRVAADDFEQNRELCALTQF